MYLRQLQIRLINNAAAQQFRGNPKNDLPLRELSELGPILRKYGETTYSLALPTYTASLMTGLNLLTRLTV